MAKFAKLTLKYYKPVHYDGVDPTTTDGQPAMWTYSQYADIFIDLRDEYGLPVDGNYVTVTYQEIVNGQPILPTYSVAMAGSRQMIRQYALMSGTNESDTYTYDIVLVGDVTEPEGPYVPPGSSDVQIVAVTVTKKESSTGANDGEATIVATSSAGNIQYSLDEVTWQDSPTFTNLSGGWHVAYVRDLYNTPVQKPFTVDTIGNLLIGDPVVDTGNGNLSRWNAAFNPIVFTYQRRDFGISGITPSAFWAKTTFSVNGALSAGSTQLMAKDLVYIKAGPYNGVYEVDSVDLMNSTITIDRPYLSTTDNKGFININKLRPYYQVCTQIGYQDKLTGMANTITCTHRPNQTGVTKADISSFLQSLLRAKDDSDRSQINYRDDNLSASYTIKYAETWQNPATGKDVDPAYIAIDRPYYVTFSARQLGDLFGGNMAAYVPFKAVDAPSKRASWVTDLSEPAYSIGYPFDIGFIYGDDLAGLNLYAEMTALDINRQPLTDALRTTYLLNEDSSFLLQQDNSKLIIIRQPVSSGPVTTGIAEHIGLNRLKIDAEFDDRVYYFDLELKYADGGANVHTITQKQTIRIDKAGDDNSVYLRWIGLTGSWNYYRFVYNQEITLDVQNAVIVKNHILDWANQDAMEDVISKSAGIKMKVMAEDLSVADIKGLQSIKYSPKVQMLVNRNPVKWQTVVLNTATFAEYETRNGQAPFSVTFNLPGLNIQTQ